MPRVERAIEIAAPPEKVWQFITEPEKLLQWGNLKQFEFMSEQRDSVGTPFYVVAEESGGRLRKVDCIVTGWAENDRFAFRGTARGIKRLDSEYLVKANESGSKLTITEDVTLPWGIIGKIIGWLFVCKRMQKDIEGKLANLKKLLEEVATEESEAASGIEEA